MAGAGFYHTKEVNYKYLKGQCRFEFFRKFAEIFAAQGLPPVSTTPVANGKKPSSRKILIILFGHL
jgi:hypothetical protein